MNNIYSKSIFLWTLKTWDDIWVCMHIQFNNSDFSCYIWSKTKSDP